jgi:hypothetical protein
MVTLRCTQKLLKRLKVSPSGELRPSTSQLGDWYAAPFAVGHLRLVMCVSERSLLPVFVRARGLAVMIPDFRGAVITLLAHLGLPKSVLQFEQEQLSEVAVGPTDSRSVLGSMNDFALHGRAYLESTRRADLVAMSLELSEIPCGPLKYNRPKDAVRELLGAA